MPVPLNRPLSSAELADAAASVSPLSAAVTAACASAGPGATVLAWLSDIHIAATVDYGAVGLYDYATKVDAGAQTRLALAEIAAMLPQPAALLLGGDVCDRGELAAVHPYEAREARKIFRESMVGPITVLPIQGNHDGTGDEMTPAAIEAFRGIGASWPKSVVDTDYYYAANVGSWRVLALDSRAGIGREQRQWLAGELSLDKITPTVVISHGPWLKVDNWVDDYRLGDDETFELIESAPNVKLVMSGHTHKRRGWDTGRTKHVVFPACCYGIDDATGWGAIVLGAESVETVFVKELKTTRWASSEKVYIDQAGSWSTLPIEKWVG